MLGSMAPQDRPEWDVGSPGARTGALSGGLPAEGVRSSERTSEASGHRPE